MDVVICYVGKSAWIEVELAGDDVFAGRVQQREVAVSREWAVGVVARQLRPILLSVLVVERGKDDRRTELAFVDKIDGALKEAVETNCQRFAEKFLFRPGVEIIRALRYRRRIDRQRGRRGRANEFCDILAADQLKGRRRVVACVADVQRRVR